MANAIYPKAKEGWLDLTAGYDVDDLVVKVALVDLGTYTYNAAHDFFDDITGVVGTPQTIANTTVVNGLFDGDNVTFVAVSGVSVEALVYFIDSGVASTSPLIMYIDTGQTGLPVTPNGGDITITFDAAGIFQL